MFRNVTQMAMAALLFVTAACFAQTYTGEPSNRVKINLGETPWKFIRSDPGNAQSASVSDAAWKDVGIPHTWNDTDTYINEQSGGGDGSMWGGVAWYRKHFTLDNSYSTRKIFVEFEGANIGAAVYINGTFIPGNSTAGNPNATHVIGFIGFVVDITPYVHFGGTDNLLAVRVSNSGGFYTQPSFSFVFRFGQQDGGLFRPVWLHITDKVHVPLNLYSVLNQWGTYVATTAASATSATVKILTNVQNEGTADQSVSLTVNVVDSANNIVATATGTQTVAAGKSSVFNQTATISNPRLWYPNNSTFGKPYLYKVYHIVKVGGATVDVFESPLGIRTLTWNSNFPIFNSHPHYLYGASARYDYPALGTALPNEVEFRDAKLLAGCGGSLWRPGHSSCSPGFVDACDAYGIMLIQPSGEGEGAFSTGANPTAYNVTLKEEVHRDMVIRDRNHPSILAWEASNGDIEATIADQLRNISNTWDSLSPRAQAVRGGPEFAPGDLLSCTLTGCEILVKSQHPNNPAWGAEAWGRASQRSAYDYELQFAGEFLQNWKNARTANCFGLCQWYLAETPGENQNFVDGTAGTSCRSFGSSMVDFNRFPKFLYYAYGAAWVPYSISPRVSIANHWNRSGNVTVNVFSNCPKVRLLINNVAQGTDKVPNVWNTATNGTTQTSTDYPMQCTWNVTWATGTLTAQGLDANGNVVCTDQKVTAGNPDHIVLSVEPPITNPATGETFQIKANGSDAAFIIAKIVDAQGNWCPTATNLLTFSVSALGNYRGSSNQFVTAGQWVGYHAPLDPNLTAEGGLMKVAVRSLFTPGTVTVTATSPGLGTGTTSFPVVAVGGTSARRPAAFSAAGPSQAPGFEMEPSGKAVRYFSSPSIVAFEILNAGGRMLERIPGSKQAQGWHQLQPSGSRDPAAAAGNGIYFIRCSVNGTSFVKRVFLIR